MKAPAIIETTARFACPDCGAAAHSCSHLEAGQSFGPWYCDDCGCGVTGTSNGDGSADIEISPGQRMHKTLVLLRLHKPLSDGKQVHIVVSGMAFQKAGEALRYGEGNDYLYNEHTCPWNYLRLPIKEGDDPDPHGIFVHQETIPVPEGYDEDESLEGIEQWREMFPSLREGSEVAS